MYKNERLKRLNNSVTYDRGVWEMRNEKWKMRNEKCGMRNENGVKINRKIFFLISCKINI